MQKTKPIYLWKSMRKGLKSDNGNVDWKVGEWFKHDGKVILCQSGFHASERIIDAIGYVNCEILSYVEVRGDSDIQEDKQAWSEMKIIKTYEWTKEMSVKSAIFAAEKVIGIYEEKYPKDNRPRNAIEVAKKYLKGEISADAAADAAYASADAARAARAAAYAESKKILTQCENYIKKELLKL